MVEKRHQIYLKVGSSPSFRINGEYTSSGFPVLTADEARDLMGQMTTGDRSNSLRQ